MSSLEPVPGWARNTGHLTVGALGRVDVDSVAARLAITERVHLCGWACDERDRGLLTSCFTRTARGKARSWEAMVSDLTGTSGVAHAYLLLTASTGGEVRL